MNLLFKIIPVLSHRLGSNPLTRIELLIKFYVLVFVSKVIKRDMNSTFPFQYNNISIPMQLSTIVEIAALKEIYIDREYSWDPGFEIKTILDLGAHTGDTTLYYHALYPRAKIIALEPSPQTFKKLKKNTAKIPNIEVIQGALGSALGKVTLHISPSSLGSSVRKRKVAVEKVEVKQYSLDSLLQLNGGKKFDLIKFDIEGGEDCLFSGTALQDYAKAYIGELHFDLIDTPREEALAKFSEFQLDVVQLSNQDRVIAKATAETP